MLSVSGFQITTAHLMCAVRWGALALPAFDLPDFKIDGAPHSYEPHVWSWPSVLERACLFFYSPSLVHIFFSFLFWHKLHGGKIQSHRCTSFVFRSKLGRQRCNSRAACRYRNWSPILVSRFPFCGVFPLSCPPWNSWVWFCTLLFLCNWFLINLHQKLKKLKK